MLNLYVDVQAKLRREFRNYGANIVASGKGRRFPSRGALSSGWNLLWAIAVWWLRLGWWWREPTDGQAVVVAGTDFERVRQLDHWWSVSAWPSGPQQALVGVRALRGGVAEESELRS